jgi:hypothetical protein
MQTDNGLAIDSEEGDNGTDFWGKAKFNPIPVSLTVPNTPYLVKVENASSDEDVSFEVQQYGSDVDATVNTDGEDGNYMNSDYTFTGEHASGTIGSANHAFTHYGSYSGKKLSKDGGWFYFAQGKFYNSKNLSYKYDKVYVYPFRAYFSHESSNGAKLMGGFNVSFDDDWTTGISDITAESDNSGLQIMTSHGSLSMRASAQAVVTIISASGATLYRTSLNAGETKAVNLSAGIYIVNGKKVIIP